MRVATHFFHDILSGKRSSKPLESDGSKRSRFRAAHPGTACEETATWRTLHEGTRHLSFGKEGSGPGQEDAARRDHHCRLGSRSGHYLRDLPKARLLATESSAQTRSSFCWKEQNHRRGLHHPHSRISIKRSCSSGCSRTRRGQQL